MNLVNQVSFLDYRKFSLNLGHFLHRVWQALAIGTIPMTMLLGILYFCLLTPVAICFRLLKRDPLKRSWDAHAKSYRISQRHQ